MRDVTERVRDGGSIAREREREKKKMKMGGRRNKFIYIF